jgi:hypothetical protein
MNKYWNKKWRNLKIAKISLIIVKVSIITFLFQLLIIPAYGQEEIRVGGAEGFCIISNITPEQAQKRALKEAKINALRMAGIPELIHSTDILNLSEHSGDFQQLFNSISSVEIFGAVTNFEIIKEDRFEDDFENWVSYVVINATVQKWEKIADPEFFFNVSGIDNVYRAGEYLEFSVFPSKKGYARIFLFDNDLKADQIFPNDYESNNLLEEGVGYNFPQNPMINYTLTCNNQEEMNNVVFILTKKNIKFLEEINYQSVIEWIYSISPEDRAVSFHSIKILK